MIDRLGPELSDRLRRRLQELAPLGTLAAEEAVVGPEGEAALAELAERLRPTYPFGEPNYAGQMLKPPHPIAWAAYAATMLLNPNNHALDGGPATSELEREAVGWIADMFGFDEPLGHLTSSGTFANLEALWIAKSLHPDKVILSGENAHYTHERLCAVLSAPHEPCRRTSAGGWRWTRSSRGCAPGRRGDGRRHRGHDVARRARRCRRCRALCEAHGARLHVDAAYGGFFTLLADGREPAVAPGPFRAIPGQTRSSSTRTSTAFSRTDAVVSSSAILRSRGSTSMTRRTRTSPRGTSPGRDDARVLSRRSRGGGALGDAPGVAVESRGARLAARRRARGRVGSGRAVRGDLELVIEPELDIVCLFSGYPSATAISESTERAFESLADMGWHVAKLRVDTEWLCRSHPWVEADAPMATVLRLCLLKPEHLGIIDDVADRLIVANTPAELR